MHVKLGSSWHISVMSKSHWTSPLRADTDTDKRCQLSSEEGRRQLRSANSGTCAVR